jgi:hypothetical protein
MEQVTAWKWWQDALAGNFGPIHEGHPQQGFYRVRDGKQGPYLPVVIWNEEGRWIALRNGKEVRADDIWTWCCRNPITEEAYYAAMSGKGWADEPLAPTMGHNLPDDPHEALRLEYEAEKETASELLKVKVTSQEHADKIAVLSKRIAAIAKKATDLHKVEKQPHLDAGRAVDDRWRDLKEDPADLSKRLKRHMDDYLLEQQRLERERQELARREEERLRREAEEAARKAAEADQQSEAERKAAIDRAHQLEQEAAAKAKEAEARNASAGRTGAKVALRTFVSARVTDYEAAAIALLKMNHADLKACIDQLANRAVKAGVEVAGVERVEEQRAA